MSYSNRVCVAILRDVAIPVDVQKLFSDDFSKNSKNDVDYYYCSDINFNREYSQCLLKFITELSEEEFGFIRIGESITDIEVCGDYEDFEIYPYTKISTPFDDDEDNFEV